MQMRNCIIIVTVWKLIHFKTRTGKWQKKWTFGSSGAPVSSEVIPSRHPPGKKWLIIAWQSMREKSARDQSGWSKKHRWQPRLSRDPFASLPHVFTWSNPLRLPTVPLLLAVVPLLVHVFISTKLWWLRAKLFLFAISNWSKEPFIFILCVHRFMCLMAVCQVSVGPFSLWPSDISDLDDSPEHRFRFSLAISLTLRPSRFPASSFPSSIRLFGRFHLTFYKATRTE